MSHPKHQKKSLVSCRIFLLIILLITELLQTQAQAHGFTANKIRLTRDLNGEYRITIWYTHISIGEFREASISTKSKMEAEKIFEQLKAGAEFFLGDIKKTMHFHPKG